MVNEKKNNHILINYLLKMWTKIQWFSNLNVINKKNNSLLCLINDIIKLNLWADFKKFSSRIYSRLI